MARHVRHAPSELSAPRLAGYAAAAIAAGLVIAVAGHYVGRLTLQTPPTGEKLVKTKRPARHGPTQAELLDAQQPLEGVMEYPAPGANTAN